MNFRKSLPLLLALALAVSMAVPALAEGEPSGRYGDMAGHWAEEIIDRWSGYGVVQGDQNGNFNPDRPITRGSMATVVVNLLGLSEKPDANPYADLQGGEWYADAVLKCTAAGIMQGDGSKCNAEANVTRQEATVMFTRALNVHFSAAPDLSKFPDGGDVASWAAGAVSAMAERGIITGTGNGTVSPTLNIDRSSTMAILDKAISTYADRAGRYEAKPTGITLVRAGGVTITGKARDILVAPGTADGQVKLDNTAVSDTVTVSAPNAKLVTEKGSITSNVEITRDGVSLTGEGTVGTVAVNADHCSICLPGRTVVEVADRAEGTQICGKDIPGGTTYIIGKSSGGGSGSVAPKDPVTQHGTWRDALDSSSVPGDVKQYIRFAYLGEYQGVNFQVIPNVIPVGDGFNTSIFDESRNLWLGTDNGILILTQDGAVNAVITADGKTPEYLKYAKVTMLFSDGGSGAWVLCGDPATEENAVSHIAVVE